MSLYEVPFLLGDLYPLDIRRVKGVIWAPRAGRLDRRSGVRAHFSSIFDVGYWTGGDLPSLLHSTYGCIRYFILLRN